MATRSKKTKATSVPEVQNEIVNTGDVTSTTLGDSEMTTQPEQTTVEPTEVFDTEVATATATASSDETDEAVKTDEATDEGTIESDEDEAGEDEANIDYQGEVEKLIASLGYEQVFHKLTAKAGTKMEQAVEIYTNMFLNGNSRRCDVIREFMKKLDMSQDGASTYFQNIKKKVGGRD